MDEQTVVHWLTGPNGGLLALGAIVGIVATWTVNLKIISPILQRAHAAEIAALQSRIEAMETAFKAEMASLRARVQELESTEAEYHKILKERAHLLPETAGH